MNRVAKIGIFAIILAVVLCIIIVIWRGPAYVGIALSSELQWLLPESHKGLGLSPENFRDAFNTQMEEKGVTYRMPQWRIDDSTSTQVVHSDLVPGFSVVGVTDKYSGNLTRIDYITQFRSEPNETALALQSQLIGMAPMLFHRGEDFSERMNSITEIIKGTQLNGDPHDGRIGKYVYSYSRSISVDGAILIFSVKAI